MKAMILAAGIGSRLRPITDTRPKALVELAGVTLLEHVISKLQRYGYDEFIINVHHFADQIIAFLKQHQDFGCRIHISDERDRLLDTGGAIRKAQDLLSGPEAFLLHNVDIITDVDLSALRQQHLDSGVLATIAVSERETSRYFLFDQKNVLVGWENKKTGELKMTRNLNEQVRRLAFSGIHIIEPRLLKMITEEGAFSMVELYLRISATQDILGFIHQNGFWSDAGKPQELQEIEQWLINQRRTRS